MSSSESEDENLKLLAESVDTTVFSDKLYKNDKSSNSPNEELKSEKIELKSQRYLEVEEEKVLKSDLNVSSHMQEFIYKKLSKIIEEKVEFVEKSKKSKKRSNEESCGVDNLRLLSDSEETVKYLTAPDFKEYRKKVEIKRRLVKEDSNTETPDDLKRIEESAVDVNDIRREVKSWSKKARHQPLEYKMINGTAYLREESNEFTKLRNKNSWNESKIKNAKYFNRSLEHYASNK